MRIRLLSLLLIILLLVGGCTRPQTSPHEPADTTTTADISHTTGTAMTNVTTTGTNTTASNYSSTSTHTIGNASTQTVAGATTSSQATPNGSTTNNVTSVATTATNAQAENNSVTFKATVRENIAQKPIEGVSVTVYADVGSAPLGSGITDRNGVAHINITKSSSYKVILSNLPAGYEAKNPYSYSTNTVNITIHKSAVYDEADHSGAQYAEGKVMTDFTLTDSEGNDHSLSDLLKEKQLVILDFWYVNCEPCKSEFPFFESAIQKYGDALALLAVNPFDSNNAINDLRRKLNANPKTSIRFPMMVDTCKLKDGFGVSLFPTTVFVNSDGVILDIHVGAYSGEEAFFAAIERYLH